MKCNNIDKVRNCSNCIFDCNDTSILENTSSEQICKVLCVMVCSHKHYISKIDIEQPYDVKVSCIGTIQITGSANYKEPDIATLVYVYSTVLLTWSAVNNKTDNTRINNKILHYLGNIEKTYSINKIRQYSIELVKEIETINTGKFPTNTFMEVNDLSFSSMSIIPRLSCVGLVMLVHNILDKVKDLNSEHLFISLRKCSIDSRGVIELTDNVESCKSTMLTTKILYSKYFNTWCKSNFTKVLSITKLKKSIDRVNKCKNISDIAGSCSDLLQEIQHTKY